MSDLLNPLLQRPIEISYPDDLATNYHSIPIKECGEKLVKVLPSSGIKLRPKEKFIGVPPMTKDYWVREYVLTLLLHANEIIQQASNNNLFLYLSDAYRPIEEQQKIWESKLAEHIGDEKIARMLVSDPTGFDKNDQSTWVSHTPIHSTGAAVDVFLWSENMPDSWIVVNNYPDKIAHYKTDYFEKKLASGAVLSGVEEKCLKNRRLLFNTMQYVGFKNYPNETWHFDYRDQMFAYLMNIEGKALMPHAKYGYITNPER